jgi:hypothetical protein
MERSTSLVRATSLASPMTVFARLVVEELFPSSRSSAVWRRPTPTAAVSPDPVASCHGAVSPMTAIGRLRPGFLSPLGDRRYTDDSDDPGDPEDLGP